VTSQLCLCRASSHRQYINKEAFLSCSANIYLWKQALDWVWHPGSKFRTTTRPASPNPCGRQLLLHVISYQLSLSWVSCLIVSKCGMDGEHVLLKCPDHWEDIHRIRNLILISSTWMANIQRSSISMTSCASANFCTHSDFIFNPERIMFNNPFLYQQLEQLQVKKSEYMR